MKSTDLLHLHINMRKNSILAILYTLFLVSSQHLAVIGEVVQK